VDSELLLEELVGALEELTSDDVESVVVSKVFNRFSPLVVIVEVLAVEV
jgi:hypothetical protein